MHTTIGGLNHRIKIFKKEIKKNRPKKTWIEGYNKHKKSLRQMERREMSTQLKFRVRAEANQFRLGETQGPAPCCFVTLNHHKHGAGF